MNISTTPRTTLSNSMPVSKLFVISFWLLACWFIFAMHTQTLALDKVMGYQATENMIYNQIDDPPNAESTRAGATDEDNPRGAPEDEPKDDNSEEVKKNSIR